MESSTRVQAYKEVIVSKMGFFAVGWLSGVASVVMAAIVADTVEKSDVILGGEGTVKELDRGAGSGGEE